MIWLIGGTSESVAVAKLIAQYNLPFVVSVTTDNAVGLYQSINIDQVFVGQLSRLEIPYFLQLYGITKVIDCSHPFATQISQSAIAICQNFNLPYLRYERPSVSLKEPESPRLTVVDSYDALITNPSPIQGKRVLLTIGAKSLHLFQNYHASATLFARILPYPQSLTQAYESGFSCNRLIAIRPPLTKELEKALWQMWQIEIVVTKAGGKPGGEDVKYQIAQELNISLIIISRPNIIYPLVTHQLENISYFLFNNSLPS